MPSTGGIGLTNYYLLTIGATVSAMLCTIAFSKRKKKHK
jgi:LPXTG-motif cell wall-anchored protein